MSFFAQTFKKSFRRMLKLSLFIVGPWLGLLLASDLTAAHFFEPCPVFNTQIKRGHTRFFLNGTNNSGLCEIWTCLLELEAPKRYTCEDLEAKHTPNMEPILVYAPDNEIMLETCGVYHCFSRLIRQALEGIEEDQKAFDKRINLLRALQKNDSIDLDETLATNKSLADALYSGEEFSETEIDASMLPNVTLNGTTENTLTPANASVQEISTNHTIKKRGLMFFDSSSCSESENDDDVIPKSKRKPDLTSSFEKPTTNKEISRKTFVPLIKLIGRTSTTQLPSKTTGTNVSNVTKKGYGLTQKDEQTIMKNAVNKEKTIETNSLLKSAFNETVTATDKELTPSSTGYKELITVIQNSSYTPMMSELTQKSALNLSQENSTTLASSNITVEGPMWKKNESQETVELETKMPSLELSLLTRNYSREPATIEITSTLSNKNTISVPEENNSVKNESVELVSNETVTFQPSEEEPLTLTAAQGSIFVIQKEITTIKADSSEESVKTDRPTGEQTTKEESVQRNSTTSKLSLLQLSTLLI